MDGFHFYDAARCRVNTSTNEMKSRRHALASTSTVNTALRRLLAESTIEQANGLYRLADPLLAHHLKKQA